MLWVVIGIKKETGGSLALIISKRPNTLFLVWQVTSRRVYHTVEWVNDATFCTDKYKSIQKSGK